MSLEKVSVSTYLVKENIFCIYTMVQLALFVTKWGADSLTILKAIFLFMFHTNILLCYIFSNRNYPPWITAIYGNKINVSTGSLGTDSKDSKKFKEENRKTLIAQIVQTHY